MNHIISNLNWKNENSLYTHQYHANSYDNKKSELLLYWWKSDVFAD